MRLFRAVLHRGAAGAALLLFGASAMAQALDSKVIGGQACEALTDAHAAHVVADSAGLRNSSGVAWIGVSCPVVRDNTFNVNGTRRALVRTESAGQPVLCMLVSRTSSGGFITSATDSGAGNIYLNVDVNASSALGSYQIYCRVPPGGRIHNYYVEEF